MDKTLKEHGKELRGHICSFITEYTAKHSYAPTIIEIGDSVGLKSSSSIHSHLTRLEIDGRIETKPYCPRAIRVIEKEEC